jgi:hypothetical protein
MQDLARFPNKYTDAYAFLFAVRRSNDEARSDQVAELFQRYPWRGGYSSVSFYNDLYRAIPRQQRIRIREIQYASPGVIRIEASRALSQELRALIVRMNDHWREIKDAAKELGDGLSERGFLGTSSREAEVSAADRRFLERACGSLGRALAFDGVPAVHRLCDHDWVATAKIVLSFYRRLLDLSDFCETGKASLD